MASQKTKILDITRGFIPVDPNAFPETLHDTTAEDAPEQHKPIMFYEGYNFLPTSYGIKSYFGVNATLDVDALTSRVDRVLIIQTDTFRNIAVALCEDGIWTKDADVVGSWFHEITLPVPPVGTHLDWTYCVISNELYCYRQSAPAYYKFSNRDRNPTPGQIEGALPAILSPTLVYPKNVFYAVTPNFLNMTGQMGIFKAGSRLGFWDSANSIAWSSIDDHADFIVSVTTLAGSSIFQEVTGRIVNILSSADGFVVYATRSIVHIARAESMTMLWQPRVLLKNAGIAFMRESCSGASDTQQFAYTQIGLFSIEGNEGKIVLTEVVDYLKESKEPVYLTILQGRYLFLEILDSNYIDGLVSFTETNVPSITYQFPTNNPTEISNIFTGNNGFIQSEAERMRQLAGLPAPNASGFTPKWAFHVNNKQIIKPLTEGLPVFTDTTIPLEKCLDAGWSLQSATGLTEVYLNKLTSSTFTAEGNTFYEYSENGYQSGIYYRTAASEGVVTTPISLVPVKATPIVLPGVDNSEDVSPTLSNTWDLAAFIAYQTNIWQQRDQEVINMIGYLSLYSSDFKIKRKTTQSGSFYIEDEYTSGYPAHSIMKTQYLTYNDNHGAVSKKVSQLDNGIDPVWLELIEWANGASDDFLLQPVVTIDSGWTPYFLEYINGYINVKRRRGFVTGISPHIEITGESTKVAEISQSIYSRISPSNTTLALENTRVYRQEYRVATAHASIRTQALSTDALPPVEQVGWARLVAFDYTDTNGIPRTVTYTGEVGSPSYRWNPVPNLSIPPSSFLLQNGSIGPVYPTIPGALVYDMHLKKWGKMKQDYKVLVDYSPLNANSGNVIPYSVFGIEGGVVLTNGKIALFDKNPIDSYIKIGKIGSWRQGFTSCKEVRIVFRSPSSGKVQLESSLDGSVVELGLFKEESFLNVLDYIMYPCVSGRWHNIAVVGIYDILNMEFRGLPVGNR